MSAGTLRHFLDEAAGANAEWNALASRALGGSVVREYDESNSDRPFTWSACITPSVARCNPQPGVLGGQDTAAALCTRDMGAYLNKVRKELGIASRLIASLTALTKFGVLSLDGLEPGSPFLTQLMEDSSKELANGWDAQVKARQVIFGDGENVVMVQRFLEDPPHTVWPGHGHCSVCRCDKTAPAIASYLA
ncbi:hypothetical protein [Sinorhizobium meliloti]|uniref:hypothetical protein n=1 Tax=Rhizobium meliloti TaxID=382 RepID=UPI001F371125|nr:hypothetical protein [Sinorhizobium meliloti]